MLDIATSTSKQSSATVEKYFGKYPGVVMTKDPPKPNNGDYSGEIWVSVPGILEEESKSKKKSAAAKPEKPRYRALEVLAMPCLPPGFFFIPEPGAQVWVEFAAGDLNCPLWTGVWYSPQGKPAQFKRTPKTVAGKAPTQDQNIIRTASGLMIMLDDTESAEAITIRHCSGSTIEIDKEGKITITDSANDTSIVSRKISLGTKGGAMEKVVLGDTLKNKIEELINIVSSHVHPTGVGPSGTPVNDLPNLTALKIGLAEILSTQNTTD